MKVCSAIVATALTVSSVAATTGSSWVDSLKSITNSDKYHMTAVRAIHARVQGDAPMWDTNTSMFTSAYGATFDARFRASLDTVNTASVEGALMYVQAEGINYKARADADRCVRKNKMKYIVFYDIVFAQTNETLALYETEYGPFLPMDGGQCTPVSGADATAVFSQPCDYVNGDNGEPQIGPFVGGELKDTDIRAPYPNTYWYSFPNTAVKQKWAAKTDASRAASRRGLCDYDKLPDGVTCTFNYRIAGYVPIDDVVGITAMQNVGKNATYKSFAEFCAEDGVEFMGNATDGTWEQSIDFWLKPKDSAENAKRASKVLDTYGEMLASQTSAQVATTDIAHMTMLPTMAALTAANPACHLNVKACSGTYGCKRSYFAQMCTVCTASDTGCTKVDAATFTFPTLTKAVGTIGGTGNKDATATTASTPTPTPTPTPTTATPTPSTSGAATVSFMSLATIATIALPFFMN